MQRSAVAVLDVLGFKGIWERGKPEEVLEVLEDLWEKVSEVSSDFTGIQRTAVVDGSGTTESDLFDSKPWVSAFSDTVIVTMATRPKLALHEELPCDFYSLTAVVAWAAGIAARALRHSFRPGPSLLFRGAIAFGDLTLKGDRFLVGPAIDEAAIMEPQAEAAAIFLTDSAKEVFEAGAAASEVPELAATNGFLFPYCLPIKQGKHLDTYVVNQLLAFESLFGDKYDGEGGIDEMRQQIVKRIEVSFGSDTWWRERGSRRRRSWLLRRSGSAGGYMRGRRVGRLGSDAVELPRRRSRDVDLKRKAPLRQQWRLPNGRLIDSRDASRPGV